MIYVKIEMWPHGSEAEKYPLGEIRIANLGGSETIADYSVQLTRRLSRQGGLWRQGIVHAFPRARLGPYDLLLRALICVVGDRSAREVKAVPRNARFDDCGEPMP